MLESKVELELKENGLLFVMLGISLLKSGLIRGTGVLGRHMLLIELLSVGMIFFGQFRD